MGHCSLVDSKKHAMSSLQVLKSVGVQLLPFFSSVAAFFVLLDNTPSILIWKCLPVICLLFFVLVNVQSQKDQNNFSRRVFIALIFCCIGDGCLVWDELFIFGMVAFAIGHFFYISAFGFQPLNLPVGICLFSLGAFGKRRGNISPAKMNHFFLFVLLSPPPPELRTFL